MALWQSNEGLASTVYTSFIRGQTLLQIFSTVHSGALLNDRAIPLTAFHAPILQAQVTAY